ncbi:uncharacterized protein FFB20_05368 [Fusarium fujikuroi]|uniref:Uncharacterized protein n=1 Tax=Gibberella fujikuroi (strain CBS 195.34 / IMI 58289 / NRRL A-6831) TaxID=1279085 RepID=S0EDT6_GIBF5|nr:uncharacterized protein FFUJ_12917 [Fusarium fujikuroi IMI 58289]KLP02080.1 uncharacterized protein LW94_8853 [Fusarium fujikuroi]KLP05864.1 uncharacterized protein Y057_10385 [Fusarium fujikuroi]QGI68625.1 hypothetical protein CEK27_012596 [Fusarium fujikuroi]QGI99515.1 hypothetical protein CEK26_012584 [Fusarium fujikuroi]CCT73019.1 uncharacterized protein FFUJ_12917 [Fusarium fujikuroi IMI 58289]
MGSTSLSSDCIIKCMVDAYAYEGEAIAVQMSPERGYCGWVATMPSSDLRGNRKGSYEFVVMWSGQYYHLRKGDVAVEGPRTGGPIHDKCALDALSSSPQFQRLAGDLKYVNDNNWKVFLALQEAEDMMEAAWHNLLQ